MTASYNPVLVALSFLIAALASYAALDLASRVTAARGSARGWWLTGGATAMGIGIWSMHFVGMLAFHLSVPIVYELPLMLLSVAVAIGASFLALIVVSRPRLGLVTLFPAGIIMGVAIAGMHYIGMASMNMQAHMRFNPGMVALSVLIAAAASTAALWLAFNFRSEMRSKLHFPKIGSAAVMGLAIGGMHYTGMAAARFSHATAFVPTHTQVVATDQLGAAVIVGAFLIIAIAITGGLLDRAWQARAQVNQRLLEQTAELEKTNRELQVAVKAAQESRAETQRTTEALRASEEKLRHSQRMEDIGNLAGGVAHDFNNILTAMRLNAELLATDSPDEQEIDLRELLHSIDRAASLTQQLLAYGRRQMLKPSHVNLNSVVRRMEPMLRRLIPEHIEIFHDLDPHLGVAHADEGQIEQILTNLVLNANHAMREGGVLIIRTRNMTCPDSALVGGNAQGENVMLAVEDNGEGMSKEVRDRAFEPFFTTRKQGVGSGLGLSMVYGIAKQSGGDVTIESVEEEGTVVRVFLPRVTGMEQVHSVSPSHEQLFGTERILVVEDQDQVRAAATRILSARGYLVFEAENGADALERYEDKIDSFHLVLTDLVMPQMGGRELIARLRMRRPDCPALYMSGYSSEISECAMDGIRFLQKPFSAIALSSLVRETLDSHRSAGSGSERTYAA